MSSSLESVNSNVPIIEVAPEVRPCRRIFPQALTCAVLNLFILGFGSGIGFPTILVPAVTNEGNAWNPNETIHLTDDEASWLGNVHQEENISSTKWSVLSVLIYFLLRCIGSVLFIGHPIGSVISGVIADLLGRKKGLYVASVPCIGGWIVLGFAQSYYIVLLGIVLMGFGFGLVEGSVKSLYSEICEPSIRGTLMALIGITGTCGIFLAYLFGTLIAWRYVALICAIGPICGVIGMFFLYESPMWLLSKGRPDDALKSLSFLRGWVLSKSVYDEFEHLKQHSEQSQSCADCVKLGTKCTHPPPTLGEKFRDMARKRNQKPFILITLLNFLMQFCAMSMMRPFIVQILDAYGLPFDGSKTTVFLGLLGICSNIFQLLTIRKFGKRNIYLYTMVGLFLSCFVLGIYGFVFFPRDFTSFGNGANIISSIREDAGHWNYFAFAVILFLYFCYTIGISSIPYVVTPELFPFKSRSFYTGILSAEAQLFAFIANKVYYELELFVSLAGAFVLFGVIDLIGFILTYFMLPETEQRSLEDIELHYSDDSRGLTDINIRINRHMDVPKNSDA